MAEVIVKQGLEGVEFFGDVDKVIDRETGEKKVTSEYPAWYFAPQCRAIDDEISRIEGAFERGEVPDKGKMAERKELKKLKEKKDKIDASRPNITDKEKDIFAKSRKDLGSKIQGLMYSRSEEMKGTADAHEEYERQTTPCISLDSDQLVIARKLCCRIYDGKVSRNDASRVYKVISKVLGENTDCEVLRRA